MPEEETKVHALAGVNLNVDPRLLAFAARYDLLITAGRAISGHNKGSRHYVGMAIDVRSRGMTDDKVAALLHAAALRGMTLLDERKRRPGEKVWRGPHLHIDIPQGVFPAAEVETEI